MNWLFYQEHTASIECPQSTGWLFWHPPVVPLFLLFHLNHVIICICDKHVYQLLSHIFLTIYSPCCYFSEGVWRMECVRKHKEIDSTDITSKQRIVFPYVLARTIFFFYCLLLIVVLSIISISLKSSFIWNWHTRLNRFSLNCFLTWVQERVPFLLCWLFKAEPFGTSTNVFSKHLSTFHNENHNTASLHTGYWGRSVLSDG